MAAVAPASSSSVAAAATLSTSVLLHFPLKSVKPVPASKKRSVLDPFLSVGSGGGGGVGFVSRNPVLWRPRVSGPCNMTEMARAAAAFGSNSIGGGGGGNIEGGGLGEAEVVVLEDRGSSSPEVFRVDLAPAGLESTLNRLSKWVIAALFGIVILWKHDAEAMWAAMGSVLNSWLSITLKQILNHQRPDPVLRSDPGMPSSHAQSIFYAAFLVVLSLIQWLGINVFTVSVGTFTLTCSSYLTWLRVSQKLHTISQVGVGASLGSAFAITWFWLWRTFVLKAFISSIWVRIVVVLGSATLCAAFLLYAIRHWLMDEE